MSKKKNLPAREQRPPAMAEQPPSSLKQVVKWISVAVLICTFLSGFMTFASVLTVDVGDPLDPNNPLSYPFIVRNDMIVPLFGVTISCGYDEMKFEGEETFDTNTLGSEETLSIIGPHQKTTAPCQRDININAPLKSGIVTIGVSFSPFLWPFKTSTIRQFKADMNADKKTLWLPR
jgi:hypothetical protein